MLSSVRRLDPTQPLRRVLFYRVCYWIVMGLFTLVYRARVFHSSRIPASGGLLIVCNHQSHLDPPLVGVGIRQRNMAAIAREGLFRAPVFGWLLRSLGVIAIKESEGDAGAMKRSIEQLKAGRVVVIFPEGSRSPTGELMPFKRGTWLLLARSGVNVLPAAVEGCFDAWPRSSPLPRLLGQRVAVAFGHPIPFADLKALGADAALDRLSTEVGALQQALRQRLPRATSRPAQPPRPASSARSEKPQRDRRLSPAQEQG